MITLLNQPWAERMGWTLLHFLWQGILVAALYVLARAIAGNRISARGRYTLACASLLAMTVAPALTYWWLGNSADTAPIAGGASRTARQLASGVVQSAIDDPWQQTLPWIVLVWFAGVAACSCRLLMGCVSAAALRRAPQAPVRPEWQQTLDRLIERMHVSRTIRLLATDRVDSPSVVGWLRPVILAPAGVLCGLEPEQVEALLAHELAHIRRHDYPVNVLQGIAESLLFYHPAVWWISSQIRTEREHCCDDLAVAASGDVLVYARALAELESMRPAHFKVALSANDGSLLRRIRRLINPVAANRRSGSGAVWSLAALLLLGIAGVALTGAQDPPPPVVSRDKVWADTVKQGDMKLLVRGLGRLTSDHNATIKVAESHIQEVKQGQQVTIAFQKRKELVGGKVAVVHPEAVNGTKNVDVVLDGPLPPGINLQEQVDAAITIGGLTNVVYVGRPVFGESNQKFALFKIAPDGHSAKRVPVQFGAASVNLIEVKSGLKPGDKVILSDVKAYDGFGTITLK